MIFNNRGSSLVTAAIGPPTAAAAAAAEEFTASAARIGTASAGKSCAACHAADGGGLIGPNLTDTSWLHGGKIDEIHAVIANGVLAKGMPAWAKQLKPEEIDEVTAYVWSLYGSTPAQPKAPEGLVVTR